MLGRRWISEGVGGSEEGRMNNDIIKSAATGYTVVYQKLVFHVYSMIEFKKVSVHAPSYARKSNPRTSTIQTVPGQSLLYSTLTDGHRHFKGVTHA